MRFPNFTKRAWLPVDMPPIVGVSFGPCVWYARQRDQVELYEVWKGQSVDISGGGRSPWIAWRHVIPATRRVTGPDSAQVFQLVGLLPLAMAKLAGRSGRKEHVKDRRTVQANRFTVIVRHHGYG